MTESDSLQQAFVLHIRAYKETSALVDLFTKSTGKICVIARGIYTNRSSWKSLLQPFISISVQFKGRGELPTLQNVEPNGPWFHLVDQKLLSGLYLNELLLRTLNQFDPCPEVFDLYQNTLNALNQSEDIQPTLRSFEKRLLSFLGYTLPLKNDINTHHAIQPKQFYRWIDDQGFISIGTSLPFSNPTNPMIFSGKSLLAIDREHYENVQELRDAKRLMRLVFRPILGNKPLYSRSLFSSPPSVNAPLYSTKNHKKSSQ